MCLAQGPQRSNTGEAQTCGPSVLSQALYHWATVLPFMKFPCLQFWQALCEFQPWKPPFYLRTEKSVWDFRTLTISNLDSILPLATVYLISVIPLHGSLSMSHIVKPHTLVEITSRVLPCTPAMTYIVHPVTIIKRLPLCIILHTTLNNKKYTVKKSFYS